MPARKSLHAGLALSLGAALAIGAPTSAWAQTDGIPARVVTYDPPTRQSTYPAVDYGNVGSPRDDRHARTTWRVVEETGNCCENYVTVTPDGRLMDFGGTYVNVTGDRGQTWRQVQPLTPMVNGEGAIVVAPTGDVLGVEWDPYSGDHLQVFKYESDTGQWLYNEMLVHQPFYDREWIAVVPGPVTINGETHEYVSFIKGGYPTKEVWYYSTDGLNYTNVTSKFAEQMLNGAQTSAPLTTTAESTHDWTQPNTNGGITPLGGGDALAAPDQGDSWYLFDGQTFSWSAYTYLDGSSPEGVLQVDSAGRLHNVVRGDGGDGFVYRVSDDGGRTWQETRVALPQDHVIEELDFRANLAAGVAAVGVHAHDNARGTDQDLVFKLDITGNRAQLARRYDVGIGDVGGGSGVGSDIRFDFETIAVFPDGKVAVSFYDSTTKTEGDVQPALAVELGTNVGGKIDPGGGGGHEEPPTLGEPYASYSFDQGAQGWTTDGVPTWSRSSPGASGGEDDAEAASYGIDELHYVDNINATLTSPPIPTQAGTAVKLDIEKGFDYVHVEWSTDGGQTWHEASRYTGQSAAYPGWDRITTAFESPGGDVQVRFRFTSDALCSGVGHVCGGHQGARVDEVAVGAAA